MPLKISWQSEAVGRQTKLSVPILQANLVLTLIEDIIVDAEWTMLDMAAPDTSCVLTKQVQAYLLNPTQYSLKLNLLRQGSCYAQHVWNALLEIPVGQVMSYSALAVKLGSGPRAVARACRNNPYAGIIPCHRVVAKQGIGGFMGETQGVFIALKQQLLAYERNIANAEQP